MASGLDSNLASSFLATLAQVCAGLLALLVAGITAYFVFLQDRAAQFLERTQQERIEIRALLLDLQSQRSPVTTMVLPLDSMDRYRARYPEKTAAQLIQQAAGEFAVRSPVLFDASEEARIRKYIDGPVIGRLYLWILSEAADRITRGGPSSPTGVFPHVLEPGFEQWRKDFDDISPALAFISSEKDAAKTDLQAFADSQSPPAYARSLSRVLTTAVDTIFSQVSAIRSHLDNVAKQDILARNYDFRRRVHVSAVATMTILAFVAGVVVPLFLMAGGWSQTRTSMIVLLVVTIALLFGAAGQFVRDVSSSTDVESFPQPLVAATEKYLKAVQDYNDRASAMNAAVITALRTDDYLKPFTTNEVLTGSFMVIYPAEILDAVVLRRKLENVAGKPNQHISIESSMSRWLTVELRILGTVLQKDDGAALARFSSIGSEIATTSVATEFLESKTAVQEAARELTATLKPLIEASTSPGPVR